MVTVANLLAEEGHAIDMVLGRAVGPYLADLSSRVNLVDFGTRSPAVGLLKLVRYLYREKPPVILSGHVANSVAVLAMKQLFRFRTRIVVRIGNMLSQDSPILNPAQARYPLSLRMTYRMIPRVMPMADTLVCVSRAVADDLARSFGVAEDKLSVIYNPVVTPRLRELSKEQPAHPWMDERIPVVLAVGSLTRQKDYPTLLRAFALALKEVDARLLILGEGPERQGLAGMSRELGIEERVDMPGFAGNPYAHMRSASVYVLSSAWEGLPGALIEAMACGCPVVSTDCPGGSREILNGGQYGRLVGVGDPEQLSDAIVKTLQGGNKPVPSAWLDRFAPQSTLEGYRTALGLQHVEPGSPLN